MKKPLLSLTLAGLAALFALPAFSASAVATKAPAAKHEAKPADNSPYLIVNGKTIPYLYAEVVRGDLARSGKKPTDEDVRNILANIELRAQEAVKLGLDKPAEVQALLDLQRKAILGKLLVTNYVKNHTISKDRIQDEYNKFKASVGNTEYHVRHILVDNEKLAKKIIKELEAKKEANFAALAKEYSKDPGSASKGGDLGWVRPAGLVPPFSDAMTKLKKDEITKTPVKTKYGWHIIQLEGKRKVKLPTLDQLKGQIENKLMGNDVQAYLTELQSKAVIEIPKDKKK